MRNNNPSEFLKNLEKCNITLKQEFDFRNETKPNEELKKIWNTTWGDIIQQSILRQSKAMDPRKGWNIV